MVSSLSFMQLKWKDKSFCLTLLSQLIKNEVFLLLFQVLIVTGHWNLALYCTENKITTIHCNGYQDKRGCILMKLFFLATSIRCFAISSWVTSRPVTRCFQVSDMNGLALCFLTLAALPCGKQLFIVHFKHKADELLKLSKRSAILRAAMVAHS